MTPALELRAVSKRFEAGVTGCSLVVDALRCIDLIVRRAELVAIAGPRGAGKTTLLRCAAGMLRPTSGEIRWLGDARAVRPGTVALASEHAAYDLFLTVRETMEVVAAAHCGSPKIPAERVCRAIDAGGLSDVADARITLLSRSHRARLALAQALLTQPQILLADELLTGHDTQDRTELAQRLLTLAGEGVAVLLAARDARAVESLPARLLALDQGELCEATRSSIRPSRALELQVDDATSALERLHGFRLTPTRRPNRLRVPLDSISAEEVLAACVREGVRVHASRVVHGDANRPIG
jgi:ABC-type multidrug transport system ATPase subunit